MSTRPSPGPGSSFKVRESTVPCAVTQEFPDANLGCAMRLGGGRGSHFPENAKTHDSARKCPKALRNHAKALRNRPIRVRKRATGSRNRTISGKSPADISFDIGCQSQAKSARRSANKLKTSASSAVASARQRIGSIGAALCFDHFEKLVHYFIVGRSGALVVEGCLDFCAKPAIVRLSLFWRGEIRLGGWRLGFHGPTIIDSQMRDSFRGLSFPSVSARPHAASARKRN